MACQCGYWKVAPYPYTTASVLCAQTRPWSWIAFMKVILAAWDNWKFEKKSVGSRICTCIKRDACLFFFCFLLDTKLSSISDVKRLVGCEENL